MKKQKDNTDQEALAAFNDFAQGFIEEFDKDPEDAELFKEFIQKYAALDVMKQNRAALQMLNNWNSLTELLISELKALRDGRKE